MFDDPMPNLYVCRRVPVPGDEVRAAFDELPETITRGPATLVMGSGEYAMLRWGRWRPGFRVEVEVVEWSADASEVAIRPAGSGAVRRPFVYANAAGYVVDEVAARVRAIAWDRAQRRELEELAEWPRAS
jgi:hypothetical protein